MNDLNDCRILLVDDTKTNINVLVRALRDDYRLGVALDGYKAVEYAKANHPDLILLDIMMPGIDGFETCRRLKSDLNTRDIPIIFITAMDGTLHKTRGFEIGAVDYIIKPFDIREVKARVKTHLSLKIAQEALRNQNEILEEKVLERTRELEDMQIEVLDRLEMAAEYRDEKTGKHIKRMSEYCRILGKACGLSPKEYNLLAMASTMHDVGKIGISDQILLKPEKLTSDELETMKTHTIIGSKILAGSEHVLLQAAEIIALTHHEKWDGTGYPNQLKGEQIPLFGRISRICDVFDALISERPYKQAWSIHNAMKEIKKGRGTDFDPQLVDLFLNLQPELEKIVEKLTA